VLRPPARLRVRRAARRYARADGGLLAAGLAYQSFLALFPLLAVAYGVLALVVSRAPALKADVADALGQVVTGGVDVDRLASIGTTVGLVGLVALGYAGVSWVAVLRRAVRAVAGAPPPGSGRLRTYGADLVTLGALGTAVLASVVVTSLVGTAVAVARVDLPGQRVVLALVGLVAGLATGWVGYLVLLRRLVGRPIDRRSWLLGALLGAAGFEALKQGGALIAAVASRNVVYGAFAATVGLLAWLGAVARWTLLAVAWTAVGPVGAVDPTADPSADPPEPPDAAGST